jgi:hypothetical protein
MKNRTKEELVQLIKDILSFHLDSDYEDDRTIAIEFITGTYGITIDELVEIGLIQSGEDYA